MSSPVPTGSQGGDFGMRITLEPSPRLPKRASPDSRSYWDTYIAWREQQWLRAIEEMKRRAGIQ